MEKSPTGGFVTGPPPKTRTAGVLAVRLYPVLASMLTATKVPLSPFAVGVGIFVNFVILRFFTLGRRLLRW